jgi:hypothetical protein
MKKLSISTYKGIEYIQLSTLSTTQAESLRQTLTERTLIKILVDDVILKDCVLYSAYEKWFAVYKEEIKIPIVHQPEPSFSKPASVA